MKKIKEEQFKFDALEHDQQNRLYDLFKKSYENATGASWDQQKFSSRAYSWIFFGDPEKGGVAVRPQKSGLIKMTAAFGYPKSIIYGMKELINSWGNEKGIWTVADLNLIEHLKKVGFIRPPAFLIKTLYPMLSKTMGDEVIRISKDGGFVINTVSGEHTKYFIANKAYYTWILSSGLLKSFPGVIKKAIEGFINKLP